MVNNYEFNDFTFFTKMSELASRHQSYDLSLGLPDFELDIRLRNYLKEAADNCSHSYESLAGNEMLIEEIINLHAKRKHSLIINRNEVNIVPCSTFALFTSLKSILDIGDEVVVIQPSYYTYAPSIVINGGIPVYYDLETDFSVNWEKLQKCFSDKTRAIIVNSPQNPTGKIWKKEDWDQLYELIKNREIYLISEEIYDLYCYDSIDHYSSFLHSELKKRTFCIFSFGKMFHATGWKVSYLISNENLLKKFRSYQQYISYSTNAPCQYAIAQYLKVFDPEENQKMMQRKRNLFISLIQETPFQIESEAEGGFFQIVNFRNINKRMTDIEFSEWLTVEKNVSCLPLSAFYTSKYNSDYIRFSFAKKDELIIQALEHLRKNL
ncbi:MULTISPECIES: aminotransferase class I/II-fold pyridoxal phosphate-dependent enzyme [Chryseobacterium]|uniref:Methionine aminotransferase n=1 Tax=Chryseobacterium taihuense TaxID=1141221 RepID=A0A4U8WIA7_9FLAO|nr:MULTISPECIES: aminotransferase class I/II-fold pyridoxal phosphate-dependent enzyme [Chryseobacterium]QQV04215.1 aminotransferase class I/II-fold pyridoxal phosphate-dependent enzyme [Chryseobacterium sp. FDAARGOS 1104]VFB02418.1 Methionine aminotransferase [Chryseobacterium taihuense]